MRNDMKTILIYGAAVAAFATTALAFIGGQTWLGILAAGAGILAVSSALVKDD
jgi:hypothetical protein